MKWISDIVLIVTLICLTACNKEIPPPDYSHIFITTDQATDVGHTSAKVKGSLGDPQGKVISDYGHCWATSQNPTIEDKLTQHGQTSSAKTFYSELSNLEPESQYFVRSYFKVDETVKYSDEISFSTFNDSFIDSRDGNVYGIVSLGGQMWMAENLAYLPSVSLPSTISYTDPHYYVYGYNSNSVSVAKGTENYHTYGVLYNWPAALNSCPSGWHLPSDAEWKELEIYLGMSQSEADAIGYRGSDEGGKLKEAGTTHWNSPNTGATNESGFTALPGGNPSSSNGTFDFIGYEGRWWSFTEYSSTEAWVRALYYNRSDVIRGPNIKKTGFSVRCVKD